MKSQVLAKTFSSLLHGLLLPALIAILFLAPPASYAQDENQEAPRALPKPTRSQLMSCTQATRANTRPGNPNTCYSVFGDPASPFFNKTFSFVIQGFVPATATTCIQGKTTMLGAKCDDPPICKVIQRTGNPSPVSSCPPPESLTPPD